MGPVTAYKLISKFKTIEEVLKNNNKYIIPDNFDYEKARELFKFPVSNELYEKTDKNIRLNKPNIIELLDFLKNTKLKEKSIHEINNSLINYYLNIEGTEIYDLPKIKLRKITDFFFHK
jgi:5'-3' exonuclease